MSKKTTEGKPDPSMKPNPGYISGIANALDDTVIDLELDRSRCSLQGTPMCWRVDAAGAVLATCTAAQLSGTTLELIFGTDAGTAAGIRFADRDPAVRGPVGEFMSSENQTTGPEQPPMLPQSIDYEGATGRVRLIYPASIEATGPGAAAFNVNDPKDGDLTFNGVHSFAGTEIYLDTVAGAGGPAAGFASASNLGNLIVSAAGGVPVADFTDFAASPRVTSAMYASLPSPRVTYMMDRATTGPTANGLWFATLAGGTELENLGAPLAGQGTAALTYAMAPTVSGIPAGTWLIGNRTCEGPLGGNNAEQTGPLSE